MRKFDCLSSDCPILGPHILEASAGTGKTFSIEHIFVRLLLEEIELENILVMTFTRAATRELKNRIRSNIEKAIDFLEQGDLSWDYLNSIQNKPRAIRILSNAYAVFDRSQIFTIHGFCYRSLKEFAFEANLGFSLPVSDGETSIPKKLLRAAFKFIKQEVSSDLLSVEQMGILLKKYDSLDEIVEALFLTGEGTVVSFSDSWTLYREKIETWPGNPIETEKLIEDFQKIAPNYKATIKGDFEGQVASLAASFVNPDDPIHFRNLLAGRGSLFDFLDSSNRKVKYLEPDFLHYPQFFSWSASNLRSLIELATKPKNLMATLRSGWQEIAEPILREEEWFNPDEILNQMKKAIEKSSFASRIRDKYRAVIVDEFQDTDPLQWDIFSILFLNQNVPLAAFYLVGDPKQSIYRFRKADVYTYFKARELLGGQSLYCLDTNFRSSKKLIGALNSLFVREWLPLPRLNQTIPSHRVFAGANPISPFKDQKGEIHFLLSEGGNQSFEESFLPYAVHEIEKLILDKSSFSSYAILVKDRHQGKAALELCQSRGIPAVAKSHTPLGKTLAFISLHELFKAIASPKDLSAQRIVQAGPFHFFAFYEAKVLLEENGLVPFFRKLLMNSFDAEFEKDLRQVVEELLIWEGKTGFSFEGLFRFLKEFEKLDPSEGGSRSIEALSDAVQILTLHISKGLEFDVVFALGLSSRTAESEEADELDAEKLRQLYVAMTRAKLRLYVPVGLTEKTAPPGGLAPMELFTRTIESQEGALPLFLERLSMQESVTFEILKGPFVLPPAQVRVTETPSQKEKLIAPIFQNASLLSFTSLSPLHSNSEFELSKNSLSPVQELSSHTIPKGTETGIMIHQIFEHLFSQTKPIWRDSSLVESLVYQEIAGSSLDPWKQPIAEMVLKTLRQPLVAGGKTFCLLDLDPNQLQTEMEFLFESPPDFFKGFIDLVFCFEDRYYIVDWKTNWLGSNDEAYSSLNQTMTAHDYWLQGAIYAEALCRHVKQFDMRSFEDIFGGAFYLFVRAPAVCHFIPDLNLIKRVSHGS